MQSTNVEIGKRYEFCWPKRKPTMKMIGTVVGRSGEGFNDIVDVLYDPSKEPHGILLFQARIKFPSENDPNGFWFKSARK